MSKRNARQSAGFEPKTDAGKALARPVDDRERAALARNVERVDPLASALVAAQDDTLDAMQAEAAIAQELDAAVAMTQRAKTMIGERAATRIASIQARTR